MNRVPVFVCALGVLSWSASANAFASAEVLSTDSYQYGRFEASIEFVSGSGVVGSFFLWKNGSEEEGVFWNELDFETVDSDCQLKTNAYYGDPAAVHSQSAAIASVCGGLHTFAYEWTPDYVAWLVDGAEVRRETGEAAAAYRDNATDGMQFRFNIWPGDASFGGTFDPSLLPVYQRVDWVQYSSYDGSGFSLEWREDFSGDAIPEGWELGTWDSPKGLSTHSELNAGVVDGFLVLALTADDAQGIPGVTPATSGGGQGGTAGSTDSTSGVTGTGVGGNGGSGGATSGAISVTGTDGISTTGTSTTGISSVGGATATTGAATTGDTSQGSMVSSSVATSATSGSAGSTTAAVSTGGPATENATALGGTNGSSGSAANSSEGTGCACRAAGSRSTSGLPAFLAALALLAPFGIRRSSRRR